jgi:hypothetical protein
VLWRLPTSTPREVSCLTVTPVSLCMVAVCSCSGSGLRVPLFRMSRRPWVCRASAHTTGSIVGTKKAMPASRTAPRRPHRSPTRTSPEVEAEILAARVEHRRGQDWIGPELGVLARTVSRVLRRHNVPRLAECDPLTGPVIPRQTLRRRWQRGPLAAIAAGRVE